MTKAKPRRRSPLKRKARAKKPAVPMVPAVIPVVDEHGSPIGRAFYDAMLRAWKFVTG